MKVRGWPILALGLLLASTLVILVWNKAPTIHPYLFTAAALAILLVISIVGYHKGSVDKFSTISLIFIVFLLVRNVPFVATHYGVLEPGDVTSEYAVINVFSHMGKIFVIPAAAYGSQIPVYSCWPLLHTFSVIFADVLGTKDSLSPLVLPTVFSFVGFLFCIQLF